MTHNSRIRQFVFLDSRGITSWSYESVYNTGTPLKLIAKTFQFFVILKGTCKCNCYTQTVPSCLCLMDLYIAKREILENFPKIILGKSLQLLLCVAPVNIALTVAQITFQRRFRGEGNCILSLPRSYNVSWTACCLPVGLEKNVIVTFLKMSLLDQHKYRLVQI